jgi:hypothetical protein
MDFSRLSGSERTAAIASAVVVVLGIVSVVNDWGAVLLVSILAAIGMLAILFAPQLWPAAKLPAGRGLLLLVAGAAAALFWLVAAIDWIDWILEHIGDLDTLQFLVGFVATLVMAWTGWQAFQSEGGKVQLGSASSSAGAAAAPPPAAAPPAATDAPETDTDEPIPPR